MTNYKTICFVTPLPISHNPRLYKEACAADERGYNVRIIANQVLDWVSKYDDLLISRHPRWQYTPLRWCGNDGRHQWPRIKSGICQKLSKIGFKSGIKSLAEMALNKIYPELLHEVFAKEADLFIGHNLAALPVVAKAAEKFRRPFGFDIEDAHYGEGVNHPSIISPLITYLEAKYLSKAEYLTASSPFIAANYQRRYGVHLPITVLNVFPFRDRDALKKQKEYKDRVDLSRISLYWYSQTIGLDRGIQDIIKALVLLKNPKVELHLRGYCSKSVRSELLSIADNKAISKHIYFHDQVSPEELLIRTSEHDIGLALESNEIINHDLCISNKIFYYMLSGLSVIASRTSGQEWVMDQVNNIGFLYSSEDKRELADKLKKIIEQKEILERYKKNALECAKRKFNWEIEAHKFTEILKRIL